MMIRGGEQDMPPPLFRFRLMKKQINDLDLSAMMRLAEVMNDSPRKIKIGEREFEIKALRAGTQWLIAEEACKIVKTEQTFSDVIKQFAQNIPSVVRVLCLVILNDKEKIYGKDYEDLYDYIMWETPRDSWIGVLVDCLQMLDIGDFFVLTDAIDNFREMTITKRAQQ